MLQIQNKWWALAWTALAMVLAMNTWFSVTAVIDTLSRDYGLSEEQVAWVTLSVQLGFVIGAIVSSLTAVTDVFRATKVITIASLVAALANAATLLEIGPHVLIFARILTGAALALIYPTAMKLISTWFQTGRGLSMGVLVGALTLGSAFPHLLRYWGAAQDWRLVIALTSFSCFAAACVSALALKEGPNSFGRAKFNLHQIGEILSNRSLMLVNLAYFGHMWELYAMWGWILAYAQFAIFEAGWNLNASLVAFGVIAAGVPGCVLGGILAERIGRSKFIILMMVTSGSCSALIGVASSLSIGLFLLLVSVWGFSAVADSAQFSAEVTERANRNLVGSALAFQMGIGYAVTIIAIWAVPLIAELIGGWRWAFSVLASGSLIGVWAMHQLRDDVSA